MFDAENPNEGHSDDEEPLPPLVEVSDSDTSGSDSEDEKEDVPWEEVKTVANATARTPSAKNKQKVNEPEFKHTPGNRHDRRPP